MDTASSSTSNGNDRSPLLRRVWSGVVAFSKTLGWKVAVALAAGGVLAVLGWVYSSFNNSNHYVFVVVQDVAQQGQTQEPTPTGGDILRGVQHAARDNILYRTAKSLDVVKIVAVEESRYLPDVTVETIRDQADVLGHPILAIGHVSSTAASRACSQYYEAEDAQVPVILIGPTNPDITRDATERGHKFILRLLRDDRSQVDALVEATSEGGSLVVVADMTNPVYTRYIVREFLSRPEVEGRVLASAEVTETETSTIKLYELLRRANAPTIVFVGMTEQGKALVQSLEQIRGFEIAESPDSGEADSETVLKDVGVVFTDGCASTAFFQFLKRRAATVGNSGDLWRAMTVLSPAPPSRRNGDDQFDYEKVGTVGAVLAQELFRRVADEGRLSRPRMRRAIEAMRSGPEIVLTDVPDGLLPADSPLRRLRFDEYGNNTAWPYYEYRLLKGRFEAHQSRAPD